MVHLGDHPVGPGKSCYALLTRSGWGWRGDLGCPGLVGPWGGQALRLYAAPWRGEGSVALTSCWTLVWVTSPCSWRPRSRLPSQKQLHCSWGRARGSKKARPHPWAPLSRSAIRKGVGSTGCARGSRSPVQPACLGRAAHGGPPPAPALQAVVEVRRHSQQR